ncbi:uncharacterized protein LOC34622716 [Cyclospora cayetanensis]|uniref:Uncharacterized protein LOC34622716 n=1 Tax=Cyclospora cayetanensis TaxID=88456 RepID=A0A6P6RXK5_9EIME|nr:uncharacterized protein LOC34622716 [Cyclospora cayetanensis]
MAERAGCRSGPSPVCSRGKGSLSSLACVAAAMAAAATANHDAVARLTKQRLLTAVDLLQRQLNPAPGGGAATAGLSGQRMAGSALGGSSTRKTKSPHRSVCSPSPRNGPPGVAGAKAGTAAGAKSGAEKDFKWCRGASAHVSHAEAAGRRAATAGPKAPPAAHREAAAAEGNTELQVPLSDPTVKEAPAAAATVALDRLRSGGAKTANQPRQNSVAPSRAST